MEQQMIILQGIPGSGKTTWAQNFLSFTNIKENWIRISRDDLRNMRGEYWIKEQEPIISEISEYAVHSVLRNRCNVIIDETNLNQNKIDKWKEIAQQYNTVVKFKYFHISLNEAIKRDENRESPVGRKVIKQFYYKYIDDGIDDRQYVEHNTRLPNAIICDIDGTLALRNGRSPFDLEKIDEDNINEPVRKVLEKYSDSHTIILISGRNKGIKVNEDKYYWKTLDWCKRYNVPVDNLLMREVDDNRKDWFIKKDLYNTYIKNKYNISFVFDDRNQVVDMWRNEGIPCFQVWYEDF